MFVSSGLILELSYEIFAYGFRLSDILKYLNDNIDKH